MQLKLKELRKKAGYKSQTSLANKLGVNSWTYRTWERGDVVMNIEQLWQCCVALNVSPNEVLGWKSPPASLPADETRLIERYRACTDTRKESLQQQAKDAATLSKAEKNEQKSKSSNEGVGDVA